MRFRKGDIVEKKSGKFDNLDYYDMGTEGPSEGTVVKGGWLYTHVEWEGEDEAKHTSIVFTSTLRLIHSS